MKESFVNYLHKWIALGTALLIGGGALYVWQYNGSKNGNPLFITAHAERRDLTQFVTASGTLRVTDQISIGSLVTGRVTQILVDDNDHIQKDQVLAIIDNGVGDSGVKRVSAQLDAAEQEAAYQAAYFTRQKLMHDARQLSDNEFENIQQQYKISQARVRQLKAELELEKKTYKNLFITSPESGIVIAKKIDLGQMVASQLNATVLFEIGKDLRQMEGYIDVDEADIGAVKEGQLCYFTVDSFPKEKFEARVKRVEFQAKIVENVVTYATVLDVKNPELRLRPGMTTNVDIKIAEAQNALALPNKALRISSKTLAAVAAKSGYTIVALNDIPRAPGPKQNKLIDDVWVVKEPDQIVQVAVQLGVNDGKYSQVLSGIDERSNVIIEVDEGSAGNQVLTQMFKRPGGIGK